MKLKYKLFITYLILITFISIALLLLVLQVQGIDYFVRIRIEQDVQEVIDLTYQQQILEDVYSKYLLLLLPDPNKQEYLNDLGIAVNDYVLNWERYRSRSDNMEDFSFLLPIDYFINSRVINTEERQKKRAEKQVVEKQCEDLWNRAENQLQSLKSNAAVSVPDLKSTITTLREELIRLSEMIGKQARESGVNMRDVADAMNLAVFMIIIGMVFVSLLIAFFVARKFSKPLEELKSGIEQVAIQNFDVRIPKKSNDEIGELASAFEQMALRLKKNETFKTEMLGQFTHEMKSPVVAVYQAIQLLEKTIGPEPSTDQKRLLSIINSNNETLSNLITNILHSASYDGDTLKLDLRKENITKLFTNSLMKLAPTVKVKNIKVDLNFSSEKIECQIDKDRMEEVFINLLSNAIKFSPEGSTLQVMIMDNGSSAEFKIKDQGIGIPAKEIPYIFEKMYRASNSSKISVKGTGLGLYITSQIVKAHGGKIKVKSKENHGTVFTVQIPIVNDIVEDGLD
jgi:signal transduction histidine kinase